ncbi:MAG: hypothetical protein ACK4OM_05215 [Alphaproteobacteria bacterium]
MENIDELVPKDSDSILNPNIIKEINPQDVAPLVPQTQSESSEQPDNINKEASQIQNQAVENSPSTSNKEAVTDVSKEAIVNISKTKDTSTQPVEEQTVTEIGKSSDSPPSSDFYNNKSYIMSDWSSSLMFSNEELANINETLINSSSEKKLIPNSNSNDPTANNNSPFDINFKAPEYSPTFYLNSIIYRSPTDWVIWINKNEIRANSLGKSIELDKDMSIEILKVYEKYIVIKWKTYFLDSFCPEWKNILNKGVNSEYYSDNNNNNIIVDEDSKFIVFKLKVNQTFNVNQISINEGYIAPTKIEAKVIDKAITSISDSINK